MEFGVFCVLISYDLLIYRGGVPAIIRLETLLLTLNDKFRGLSFVDYGLFWFSFKFAAYIALASWLPGSASLLVMPIWPTGG